jgi:hypothetical protein
MAMFMLTMVVAVQAFSLNLWDLVTHTKTVTDSTGKEKTEYLSSTRAAKTHAARKHGEEKTSMLEEHRKSEESDLEQTDEASAVEATALNQVEAELVKAGVAAKHARQAAEQILAAAKAKNGGKLPVGGHIHADVKLPTEWMASFTERVTDEHAHEHDKEHDKEQKKEHDKAHDKEHKDKEMTVMSRTEQRTTLAAGLVDAGLHPDAAKEVSDQIMEGVADGQQISVADVELPESLLMKKK